MNAETKHPADEIARALSRANGILAVITGCYDKDVGQFEAGVSFLYEAINTVEGLLQGATEAVGRLYETCDLTILHEPAAQEPAAPAPVEYASPQQRVQEPLPMPPLSRPQPRAQQAAAASRSPYLAGFGPSDHAVSLAERVESAVSGYTPPAPARKEALFERPATTYEEFLAKLTAVADQAAVQAGTSSMDRSILPALEGLRADLMKMRSVA